MIEEEYRLYIREKLKDETVRMLVYASSSFAKQRRGLHQLMTTCSKQYPELYHKLPWTANLICGWADDYVRMFGIIWPDFKSKFFKGISVGKLEEITEEELFNKKTIS